MTKKDFELIAATFQDGAKCGDDLEKFADRMSNYLKATNPRFDRDRFLRACVPGANVRARS